MFVNYRTTGQIAQGIIISIRCICHPASGDSCKIRIIDGSVNIDVCRNFYRPSRTIAYNGFTPSRIVNSTNRFSRIGGVDPAIADVGHKVGSSTRLVAFELKDARVINKNPRILLVCRGVHEKRICPDFAGAGNINLTPAPVATGTNKKLVSCVVCRHDTAADVNPA